MRVAQYECRRRPKPPFSLYVCIRMCVSIPLCVPVAYTRLIIIRTRYIHFWNGIYVKYFYYCIVGNKRNNIQFKGDYIKLIRATTDICVVSYVFMWSFMTQNRWPFCCIRTNRIGFPNEPVFLLHA